MGVIPVLANLAYDLADKPNPTATDQVETRTSEERNEVVIRQLTVMIEAADEHLDSRNIGVGAKLFGLGIAADAEMPKLKDRRKTAAKKMYVTPLTFKRWKEAPLLETLADYLIHLAEEHGHAVDLDDEDTAVPSERRPPSPDLPSVPPSVPSPKRHWGRPSAVVLGLLLLVGLVALVLASRQPSSTAEPTTTLSSLATESERQLIGDHAPVPGDVSRLLGFGDPTPEGRTVYPYVAHKEEGATEGTLATPTPTLNSMTDVNHGIGDEREFVHVAIGGPERPHAANVTSRSVVAQGRQDIWLRIYIDNNAAEESDCERLIGPTIAVHTTARVAVWNSSNKHLHVLRVWVFAENANPTWVTDAVAVVTQSARTLKLIPSLSSQYSELPKTYLSHPPLTSSAVVDPAGMLLGGNGLLGSCWQNRFSLLLLFRQV